MFKDFNASSTLGDGLNKYQLLQSGSEDITAIYEKIFEGTEGSLTMVIDNDAISKFRVAIVTYTPTGVQCGILEKFENSFRNIENEIDPDRLSFTVTKAYDDEICINRTSELGLSKIIINDDGVIAFSFIAYKDVQRNDILLFWDAPQDQDYESITYKFLSL